MVDRKEQYPIEEDDQEFFSYIKTTRFLTSHLFIGGLLTLLGGLIIQGNQFDNPDFFAFLLQITGSALVFISCIFIVIRREAPRPGLPAIKGWGAVLSGLFLLPLIAIFL